MIKMAMAVILAAGPTAGIAVRLSVFDATEMGSESVYTAVSTCVAQQGGPTTENVFRCGCLVDAMRLNFKKAKSGTNVTPEQAAQCIEPRPTPSKGKK